MKKTKNKKSGFALFFIILSMTAISLIAMGAIKMSILNPESKNTYLQHLQEDVRLKSYIDVYTLRVKKEHKKLFYSYLDKLREKLIQNISNNKKEENQTLKSNYSFYAYFISKSISSFIPELQKHDFQEKINIQIESTNIKQDDIKKTYIFLVEILDNNKKNNLNVLYTIKPINIENEEDEYIINTDNETVYKKYEKDAIEFIIIDKKIKNH